MTQEEKKTWILRNWCLLRGNRLAEALKRYFRSKEIEKRDSSEWSILKTAARIFGENQG
jgi:hypothetical protein